MSHDAKYHDSTVDEMIEEIKRLREALNAIASFTDTSASDHLERTGSYRLFDEPSSAQTAREAIAKADAMKERL